MKKFIFFAFILFFILLFGRQSYAQEWFEVKWVFDGDTIVLKDGRRVRYIGINAPEIDHDNQKAEPFGYKATGFNKRLVLSKKVRLEFDKQRHDQYKRLLAYVFLEDGTFVNAALAGQGYAYLLYYKSSARYYDVLLKSQHDAMSAKKGMWNSLEEKERVYVGNKRSKRFHLETCPFGKKIADKNRRIFSKKWDAFWQGYAPCKKCVLQDH